VHHDKRDPRTGAYAPLERQEAVVLPAEQLDQADVLAGASASILRAVRALQVSLDRESARLLRARPQDKPRGERRVALLALQLRRLTSGLAEGSAPPDDGRIRLID
jgi:hypothetical protein